VEWRALDRSGQERPQRTLPVPVEVVPGRLHQGRHRRHELPLAIRDWSAYDLTGYMRTSAVRSCWPRTESRLYQEPKNLVSHGFAESSVERTGARTRTVYSITAEGRAALRRWHDQGVADRQIEDEIASELDELGAEMTSTAEGPPTG
jgi:DNA-binding PadR family transcriptional regulator